MNLMCIVLHIFLSVTELTKVGPVSTRGVQATLNKTLTLHLLSGKELIFIWKLYHEMDKLF